MNKMKHLSNNNFKKLILVIFIVLLYSPILTISKTYLVTKADISSSHLKFQAYNQILLAVKYAEDGDTIMIDDGWYDNDFTEINKRLVIIGKQSAAGYRKTERQPHNESILSFTNNPTCYLYINVDGVVIDGIKFGIENQLSFGGIYINAANVEIRNCLFAKNSGGNIYISAKGRNTKIIDNFLLDSECENILNNAESVVISGNFISNNSNLPVVYSTRKITAKTNSITSPGKEKLVVYGDYANLSFIAGNEMITPLTEGNADILSDENTKEGLIPPLHVVPNKLQSFFDNQNCPFANSNYLVRKNHLKLDLNGFEENVVCYPGFTEIQSLCLKQGSNINYESIPQCLTLLTIKPNKLKF